MEKKLITCVFFGKSGAGKGTQADFLMKHLNTHDPKTRVAYIETGAKLRTLKETGTFAAKLIGDVMHRGGFLPPFIPIYLWTSLLLEEVRGEEHLIFDGVARQPEEGPILDKALQFFKRHKPVIIYIEISEDEARKRLLKRGRHDDTDDAITARFESFKKGAVPSIEHFRKSPHCKFVTINGEQSIAEVHEDIVKALGI